VYVIAADGGCLGCAATEDPPICWVSTENLSESNACSGKSGDNYADELVIYC